MDRGLFPGMKIDLQPEPNFFLGIFVRQANCTFAFGPCDRADRQKSAHLELLATSQMHAA